MRKLILSSLLLLVPACSSSSAPAPQSATAVATTQTGIVHKKVSHSTRAAALRAPWVNASQAPTGSTPPSEPAALRYPAFAPNAPQIVNNGGAPTLAHMKIVTMTWNDDPFAGDLELFGDRISSAPQWSSIAEYGVGATVSGPSRHYRGTNFPATITDVQLDALVQQSVLDPATSGWPADEPEQLYAIYLPATTQFLVDNGDGTTTNSCRLFGAYHTATQPTTADGGAIGKPILYAVMPRCGQPLDQMTGAASHEFGETATDPEVLSNATLSWVTFDANHLAYDMYQSFQDEVGDACEFFGQSFYEEAPPFTFAVQRLWSNRSIAAGHNPCLPLAIGDTYYNATTFANQMSTITVDLTALQPPSVCSASSPCTTTTQGYKAALGQPVSFDIGFYSDAPTADWTVQAWALPTLPIGDFQGNPVANGTVNITIARPTGNNGHKAHVTVTPLTAGALGVEYIELQSGFAQYDEAHSLPILIGQN
jgi:hypothetical protein